MAVPPDHRKQVRHYHDPGDIHELTFSCYDRMPLLSNDRWRTHLARSLDEAMSAQGFRLAAFVFMPEHVHLVVYPVVQEPRVDRVLAAIKRPCSVRVKEDLLAAGSRLIEKLTVRERPGKTVFRFWQEGTGYDRNLKTIGAVISSIEYLHLNPVRRGLCERAVQWRWSSARFYECDGGVQEETPPRIEKLPANFFD
jgi:putative transposase